MICHICGKHFYLCDSDTGSYREIYGACSDKCVLEAERILGLHRECLQCGSEDIDERALCQSCEMENEMNRRKVDFIMKHGHPEHCAKRQVWGDGECECEFYETGYNPYLWFENLYEMEES